MRVAVLGGGISGLSAAYEVREALREAGGDHRVTLYEADDSPGGKIRSEHIDGYTLEWGPNGFLDNKAPTLELVEKLGLKGSLLVSSDAARKRYLCVDSELHRLPESPGAFAQSPLLSWRGKARLLSEVAVPGRRDEYDESIANFAQRRIGGEALNRLIGPMVSGVHAGDPRRLSIKAAFPRIAGLEEEHGGLFRGMIAKARSSKGDGAGPAGPGGTLTSFAEGMQTLTDRLAEELGEAFQSGHQVRSMAKQGDAWRLTFADRPDPVEADLVISTIPAYALAQLTADLSPKLAQAAGEIPYAKVAVLGFGYPASAFPQPLDGFGFLVAMDTPRHILGCLWSSQIYPGHRAPREHVLMRVMVGGARLPREYAVSDSAMLTRVRKELELILGVRRAPLFQRVVRWDRAIPQYNLGHLLRREIIEDEAAALGNLIVGGNGLRGIALNDCIADSLRIRGEVSQRLAAAPAHSPA